MKKYLKYLLTLGIYGDFNVAWKLRKKSIFFLPFYKIHLKAHNAYIPKECEIKGDIFFPHEINGCFFACFSKIGTGCTIMHHVTIGSNIIGGGKEQGAPQIGDNVFIGAGAKIIGPVKIGNNVKIGAGCIVVDDIPDNAVCVMNKPRIIIKEQK